MIMISLCNNYLFVTLKIYYLLRYKYISYYTILCYIIINRDIFFNNFIIYAYKFSQLHYIIYNYILILYYIYSFLIFIFNRKCDKLFTKNDAYKINIEEVFFKIIFFFQKLNFCLYILSSFELL